MTKSSLFAKTPISDKITKISSIFMQKLNLDNLSKLLIKELIEKARQIGLTRDDPFVLTIREEILEITKSYELGFWMKEKLSLKDYVRDVYHRVHYGLLFATEDFTFT